MITKIENFILPSYADEIENLLTSSFFPYYYIENVADNKPANNLDSYDFFHLVYENQEIQSTIFEKIYPIILFLEFYLNKKISNLIRIRIGMSTKKGNQNIIHDKHLDYDFPHQTFLYYVNDSDGDTRFYLNNNINTVTPKKGSGVLFDGSILHSSSTPIKTQRRITININFNF